MRWRRWRWRRDNGARSRQPVGSSVEHADGNRARNVNADGYPEPDGTPDDDTERDPASDGDANGYPHRDPSPNPNPDANAGKFAARRGFRVPVE